jgi:hypothetical protein
MRTMVEMKKHLIMDLCMDCKAECHRLPPEKMEIIDFGRPRPCIYKLKERKHAGK